MSGAERPPQKRESNTAESSMATKLRSMSNISSAPSGKSAIRRGLVQCRAGVHDHDAHAELRAWLRRPCAAPPNIHDHDALLQVCGFRFQNINIFVVSATV
jgi:hypothetical protein